MKPGITRATAEMLIARWQKHIAREKPESIRQRAFSRCIKELQEAMQSDESAARDAVIPPTKEYGEVVAPSWKEMGDFIGHLSQLDDQRMRDIIHGQPLPTHSDGQEPECDRKISEDEKAELRRRLQDCVAWPID